MNTDQVTIVDQKKRNLVPLTEMVLVTFTIPGVSYQQLKLEKNRMLKCLLYL